MSLVLYHDWGSTCSQKVRLVLAEKGLDYESRVVRLRDFEHLAPSFLAVNPEAMVPVLVHDEFTLAESSVIDAYLDAVFPDPPLLPPDPRGRAEADAWSAFIDQVTSPAVKKPSSAKRLVAHLTAAGPEAVDAATVAMPSRSVRDRWRRAARGGFDAAELDEANHDLRRTLDRMERVLAEGDWLAAGRYTLADIHALPFVERMSTLPGFDLGAGGGWPAVARWRARLQRRPAVAALRFEAPPAPPA